MRYCLMRLSVGARVERAEDGKEFEVVEVGESIYALLADDDTEFHATEAQFLGEAPFFRVVKS